MWQRSISHPEPSVRTRNRSGFTLVRGTSPIAWVTLGLVAAFLALVAAVIVGVGREVNSIKKLVPSIPPVSAPANPITASIDQERQTPGSPSVSCDPADGVYEGRQYLCFTRSGTDNLWQSPITASATPTYHGGPIQRSPTVYIVGWGASSELQGAQLFASAGLNSPWSAVLGSYGVNAGTYGGSSTDSSPVPLTVTLSILDGQVATMAASEGWHLNADTQVWFVISTALTTPSASACGFHGSGGGDGSTLVAVTDAGSACGDDAVGGTLAHEYAEAATDPDSVDGYVTTTNSESEDTEIADVCVRGGWALSPAGFLPMLFEPGLGCTWGNWAPTYFWGNGAPVEAIPSTWTQCTAAATCGAWLYYPPGMATPTGIAKWKDVSGGYWVIVPG